MVIKAVKVTPADDGQSTAVTLVMTQEEAERFIASLQSGEFDFPGFIGIKEGPRPATEGESSQWSMRTKDTNDKQSDRPSQKPPSR